MTEETEIRPLQPIRRFDVFAETKRLEALAHGEPDDVAKGYGMVLVITGKGGKREQRPASAYDDDHRDHESE